MKTSTSYPGYSVLAKRNSPSWDDTTRAVVGRRLGAVPQRRFLSEAEWDLLNALVDHLLPQPERHDPIPITPWIDAMLHEGRGDGYRHEGVPPLRQAWRAGLAALDAEARLRHGQCFVDLAAPLQQSLLKDLSAGQVAHDLWQHIPAQHFFTDMLLKSAAGLYYAHPSAWDEIGFGGPASPRGYVRLGFDQRDEWEAKESP